MSRIVNICGGHGFGTSVSEHQPARSLPVHLCGSTLNAWAQQAESGLSL
jgi:hypothetical protein